MPHVMLSCGEASGDLYAGALVAALREIDPTVTVSGFGGPRMLAAGATLTGDFRGFSVTGLVEAVRVLPRSWRMLNHLADAARSDRPDVFVAIDFPDFNFRLLPRLKDAGVPIVYYVSPQLWAWRPGRLDTIRRYVDRMLVIFPFEVDLYEQAGVPVEFVGHPLIDLARAERSREDVLSGAGLDPARPTVALLPGSRRNEIEHILPDLLAGAVRAAERVRDLQFVIARAPSLDDELFRGVAAATASAPVVVVANAADDVLAAADAVITASGTATVQTALHGKPMAIVYRVAPLTYTIGKRFVRVASYGMVNLVAGRPIVTELIQEALTPQAVADEIVSLISDRARVDTMRAALAEVRQRLGGPGASARAAAAVLRTRIR